MQKRPFTPVYLARASYRKRRLVDAQKLLPVLLFLLYLLPIFWGGEGTGEPVGAGGSSYVHVFVIWGGAIAIVAAITRILLKSEASIDGEPMRSSETPQWGAAPSNLVDGQAHEDHTPQIDQVR